MLVSKTSFVAFKETGVGFHISQFLSCLCSPTDLGQCQRQYMPWAVLCWIGILETHIVEPVATLLSRSMRAQNAFVHPPMRPSLPGNALSVRLELHYQTLPFPERTQLSSSLS